MPKKKKGGDKLLKMEHQLLKDEELRRRIIEQMKEKAKEKQDIEEKNARLNTLKIQNRWREIMKKAKAESLRLDIEILQQVHERHMDRKNAKMEQLRQDTQEAEEQFQTALQSHLINVDTLIDLQHSRLETLQRQFDVDLTTLEEEFNSEKAKLQVQHSMEKSDILGIMARMEQEFQEAEADARHEYSSLKDDVKNKNLEEKHALRIQLEGTVEDLWRQFQAALNQYNASTEERKKQFEELKAKDQKNAKEIEQQMKRLVKLQETIAHLKTKLGNNAKEYEERNRALREEKEAIQVHFQELKRKMNTFRSHEHRHLTDLTIVTSKVLKSLQGKMEKAEKIVRLAEMNRKLETEEEKVLPFGGRAEYAGVIGEGVVNREEDGSVNGQEGRALVAKDGVLSGTNGQQQSFDHLMPREFQAMEQFHKRFNKVMLDQLALEKQRSQLQEENDHLRSILKQYLDGLTVNEEVLSQMNPLLVVEPTPPSAIQPPM
ncbi:Dynein regulatory complex subunit 2 [Quaeritorhiza haematococci]|nr:Dynein regulatory complex subunit 2 [Quaeritorhiza haematococci]